MPRKSKSAAIDVETACMQLIELGVKRAQFIRARIRVLNSAGALVRRALGWQSDLHEAEQKKINKDAAKIMSADDFSKLPDDLAAIAESLKIDIAISKEMAKPGEVYQAVIEKDMRKLARQFPVWLWAKDVYGLSDLGLAIIISQAGRLDNYSTHDKLKKRLGLAPITKDGVTRAASTWRKKGGLTAEDWSDTGPFGPKYSPRRRAAIYSQVGTMVIGGMGKGVRPLVGEDVNLRTDWSYYQKEFVRQLRREVEKDPTMGRPNTKDGKESFSLHARFKAQRVVEQRLLKHLWQAWRRAAEAVTEKSIVVLPDALHSDAPQGAGEATMFMPDKAIGFLPPPQFSDAVEQSAAVSAIDGMPKGHCSLADTNFSDASQEAEPAAKGNVPSKANPHVPQAPSLGGS